MEMRQNMDGMGFGDALQDAVELAVSNTVTETRLWKLEGLPAIKMNPHTRLGRPCVLTCCSQGAWTTPKIPR